MPSIRFLQPPAARSRVASAGSQGSSSSWAKGAGWGVGEVSEGVTHFTARVLMGTSLTISWAGTKRSFKADKSAGNPAISEEYKVRRQCPSCPAEFERWGGKRSRHAKRSKSLARAHGFLISSCVNGRLRCLVFLRSDGEARRPFQKIGQWV